MTYIAKSEANRRWLELLVQSKFRRLSAGERRPKRGQARNRKVACLQIAIRSLYGNSLPFSAFVENMKKVL